MVDENGSVVFSRHHEPDEEAAFHEIVERDPGDDNVGKPEDDGEEGVHDPIRHPFGVIILLWCFDGFEGGISWVKEAYEVGEKFGAIADNEYQRAKGDHGQDKVHSWKMRSFLECNKKIDERVCSCRLIQLLFQLGFPLV